MKHCLTVMKKTFQLLGQGDYLMGGPEGNEHGIMLWYPKHPIIPSIPKAGPDRRYLAMIAYIGGDFNVCGGKFYGSNVENTMKGLPRSILLAFLNDPVTSEPLALMSANLLSSMRTGAVPGLATSYLAHREASTLGIIGSGVINRACLLGVAHAHKALERVIIYDIAEERAETFVQEMKERHSLDLSFHIADSMEKAVRESDIISVATAGSKRPEFSSEWLKDGSLLLLSALSSLPDDYLFNCHIVVDDWKMHDSWLQEVSGCKEKEEDVFDMLPSGQVLKYVTEGKMTTSNIQNLSEIVLDPSRFVRGTEKKVLFIAGGLPVEDVAWGYTVYQEAIRLGIGQKLKLWDEPYWL